MREISIDTNAGLLEQKSRQKITKQACIDDESVKERTPRKDEQDTEIERSGNGNLHQTRYQY